MKKPIIWGYPRPVLKIEANGTVRGREHHDCRLYLRGREIGHIYRCINKNVVILSTGEYERFYKIDGVLDFELDSANGSYKELAIALCKELRRRGFMLGKKDVQIAVYAQRAWLDATERARRALASLERAEALVLGARQNLESLRRHINSNTEAGKSTRQDKIDLQ